MCQKCGNNACGGCQPQIPQGLPGANGKNAYNFTTASFAMPEAAPASPATNADVTITVRSTGQFTNQWAVVGQAVAISGAGYFEVRALVGNNQITVRNLGYAGNATTGTTIASGATVSPAGFIGLTGAAGANGTAGVANVYSDSTNSSTASLSLTTIKTAPVPANTLVNDNDALQIMIQASHSTTSTQSAKDELFVDFGADNIVFGGIGFWLQNFGWNIFNIRIVKTGASTATYYVDATGNAQVQGGLFGGATITYSGNLTGVDFTVINNVLVKVDQSNASSITCTGIFVDKIAA